MKTNFDARAQTWDEDPRRVKLAEDICAAIQRQAPLHNAMNALDYGCGTGLVTLRLAPLIHSITGVDSSEEMLSVLERKAKSLGLKQVTTRHMDFTARSTATGSYDLIVSSMTLHHVEDTQRLFAEFFRLMNPGGWLAIADLDSEDGSFHPDTTGVMHYGFDRAHIQRQLETCGFSNIAASTAAILSRARDYPVFLITARK